MLIQGMAYVPGCVRGVLRQGVRPHTPEDILLISQDDIPSLCGRPAGIIVLDAAPFSHSMIGLLGLGVPTIALSVQQAGVLRDGMAVVLDGVAGSLSSTAAAEPLPAKPQTPAAGEAVSMRDGTPVQLCASVRSPAAARTAVKAGASAIGLVRSEFFVPDDGHQPDEHYYRQAFGGLCTGVSPLKVTIRLLDAAVDKRPAWLPEIAGSAATLGLQGARLFGDTRVHEVVQSQLQAIAALAGGCDLEVLIPYLVRLEEFHHWAEQARALLPAHVSVGAMIETPAAALDMGQWLDAADFMAVGCNDLMQCLFAADRDNPAVSSYLDPYAPLLYRLLQQMAGSAGDQLGRVRLCGVLPQLRGVLPILLGLGFSRFSVDAVHIPYLAQTVRGLALAEARSLADQVCRASNTRQVLAAVGLAGVDYRPYRT